MPYLIDGNNLIGQTSSFGLRDNRSRLELLGRLWTFQQATRARVWVVFDGPADPGLSAECGRWKKFQVLFPKEGQRADDLIAGIISQNRQPQAIILVTSDRDLRSKAKARGVKTLSAAEFERRLKKVARERKKEGELRKPTFRTSPLEIKLWLETLSQK